LIIWLLQVAAVVVAPHIQDLLHLVLVAEQVDYSLVQVIQ
jgi:hypothetical protein